MGGIVLWAMAKLSPLGPVFSGIGAVWSSVIKSLKSVTIKLDGVIVAVLGISMFIGAAWIARTARLNAEEKQAAIKAEAQRKANANIIMAIKVRTGEISEEQAHRAGVTSEIKALIAKIPAEVVMSEPEKIPVAVKVAGPTITQTVTRNVVVLKGDLPPDIRAALNKINVGGSK